ANVACRTNASEDLKYSTVSRPPGFSSFEERIWFPNHQTNIVADEKKAAPTDTETILPCGNSGRKIHRVGSMQIKKTPTETSRPCALSAFFRTHPSSTTSTIKM